MYRSVRSFISDAAHNKLLAVPAGLYSVNNYLKFAMQARGAGRSGGPRLVVPWG